MKATTIAIASALICASSQADASPVYLRCTFPQMEPIDVTLDEGQGTATVYLASRNRTMPFRAAFSANEVRFGSSQISYVISRVDMSIIRTIRLTRGVENGSCSKAAIPKRQF